MCSLFILKGEEVREMIAIENDEVSQKRARWEDSDSVTKTGKCGLWVKMDPKQAW